VVASPVVGSPVVGEPVAGTPVTGSTVTGSPAVGGVTVGSPMAMGGVVAGGAAVPGAAAVRDVLPGAVAPGAHRPGAGWSWLRRAAESAAQAAGVSSAGPAAAGGRGRPCCRRIAMRTPGGEPGSISAARSFTALMMQRWETADLGADVAVVVSELLSNAVRHGRDTARGHLPIRLGLLHSGRSIICAVADPSDQPPVPREAGCLEESGRGLRVIEGLSDHWGACTDVPGETGKVVWASFLTAS
jgi:hypothetical protein